jgi:hypothetical protein
VETGGVQPTYPFHLAKAYGLPARPAPRVVTPQVSGVDQTARSGNELKITPVDGARAEAMARIDAARQAYRATNPTVNAAPAKSPVIARVVAGRVPGGIDFTAGGPQPSDSLSIYKHPADKNTAATGTQLGRMVDFDG